MYSPQTMSPAVEQEMRAKAFYLIKKYTSYTHLDKARELFQGFLDEMLNLMKHPTSEMLRTNIRSNYMRYHEGHYKRFLAEMIPLEQGLQQLLKLNNKEQAYTTIRQSGPECFLETRTGDEHMVERDPLYHALGLNEENWYPGRLGSVIEKKHEGRIHDLLWASSAVAEMHFLVTFRPPSDDLSGVSNRGGYLPFTQLDRRSTRRISCTTYETFFFEPPWLLTRTYPKAMLSCPPHNENPEGQVWSRKEIPVTGIWEPWFVKPEFKGKEAGPLSGAVGCPNYFLKGRYAPDYNIEGTDDFEMVRWRLLWEDKRYSDGSIPDEESLYLNEVSEDAALSDAAKRASPLQAFAGKPCPKTGVWYSPNMGMQEAHVNAGDPMPGEGQRGTVGEIIWYLKGE